MKKLFSGFIAVLVFLSSFAFGTPTQAIADWNVSGSWTISFDYQSSPYVHAMTLSQDGSGALTGSGGYPATGTPTYTWALTSGSVSGNAINFSANYTAPADATTPQTTMLVTGTIAPNGTMSGTWSDNYQGQARTGSWVSVTGSAAPIVSSTSVNVYPSDMALTIADVVATPTKWFFYNDESDVIDNSLGSFVTGPATAPLGTGSVQMSVSGTQRRNVATYQFKDIKLADITTLGFSTYSQLAGDGSLGLSERAPYLHFNVDFDNSDTWQRRLVYVPGINGAVTADTWQSWDAINNGNALWLYSGPTWPSTTDAGSTPKTWSQILALYPNAETRSTDSWLGIRVGEPYANGFTGNVDKFVFGTASGITTYNFDPAPLVPTNKDACKNGGWKTFTNPSFKNQGQCVSSVASNN